MMRAQSQLQYFSLPASASALMPIGRSKFYVTFLVPSFEQFKLETGLCTERLRCLSSRISVSVSVSPHMQ